MLAETPSLFFKKNKKEIKEGINNENISIELIKNIVIDKK